MAGTGAGGGGGGGVPGCPTRGAGGTLPPLWPLQGVERVVLQPGPAASSALAMENTIFFPVNLTIKNIYR